MSPNNGEELPELPTGWKCVRINDVCEVNPLIGLPDTLTEDTCISFIPMSAVDEYSGTIKRFDNRPIRDIWNGYKRFAEGDVLFARITPCMENGKAAIARGLTNKLGTGSTEFHVLRPSSGMIPEYIFHFIRQPSFRDDAQMNMTGTAGQLRVPKSFMEEYPLPLPPLPEQRRIVAKIESLFQEVKTARESLSRIQPMLKSFRQSVLAKAFRGELVPQNPEDEPASVLLERIKTERRKAQGKKYKELEAVDAAGLPELPAGWEWTPLDNVIHGIQYGTSDKAGDKETALPVLRMNNIQDGELDYSNMKFLDDSIDYSQFLLNDGDLLFNRTNSPELVGKTAIFRSSKSPFKNVVFASYLIRIISNDRAFLPILANLFINSAGGHRYIEQVRTQQVGQSNVNSTKLRVMPVPLPPLPEQRRIVAKIEELFAIADQIEQQAEAAKKRTDRMEQAILAKAFRGELVAQDPSDEPASVLLERIKGEKGRKK